MLLYVFIISGKTFIHRQEINELIQRGIEVGQIPERRASRGKFVVHG